MTTQFIKVGDLFINAIDIKQIHKATEHYSGQKKYTVQLRDGTNHIVPSIDINMFSTWLSRNSYGV